MNYSTNNQTNEKISSSQSKKKTWKKISTQVKSFFTPVNNTPKQLGNEIDYYHQFVFPSKLERLRETRNR